MSFYQAIRRWTNLRYLVEVTILHRLMFLSEVDNVSRLVHRFAKIVDVEVFALVDDEEFAQSTHEPLVIRLSCAVTTFRVEV